MNKCFNNIVGVRGINGLNSDYGLYVNSLPILTWPFIQGLMPDGYANAIDFVRDVIGNSVNDVISRTKGVILDDFRMNADLDLCTPGRWGTPIQFNAPEDKFKGVKISMLKRRGSRDNFGSINVTGFKFYIRDTAQVTFRLRDSTGTLWEETIESVTGGEVFTLQIPNRRSYEDYVYLEANNKEISPAVTKIGSCPGGCHEESYHRNFRIDGYNGTSTGVDLFGFIPSIGFSCDQELVLCQFVNDPEWRQALLYQTAYNLLQFGQVTSRRRPDINTQLDEKEAQLAEWESQVKKLLLIFNENNKGLMGKLAASTECITCIGGHYEN